MKNHSFVGYVASVALLGLATMASAAPASQPGSADWPCWRGPDRNGLARTSPKLLDSLPPGGPKLVWKSDYIPFGWQGGWGSPVVAEGKVFLYVHWMHPNGDGKRLKPITAQFLEELGWIPGVPDDLAKNLEDAWASPSRPAAAKCPAMNDLIFDNPDLDAFLAKQPELGKYIADFIATLKPDEAKKYGPFVKRRLCMRPKGFQGGETWDKLVKLSKLQDQEFKTYSGFFGAVDRCGIPLNADGSVEVWAPPRCTTKTDTLVCLDGATGKLLWKKDWDIPRAKGSYAYPWSTTPAAADGKVYFCGATGTYCLSAKDGSVVWEQKRAGGTQASILVDNGLVFDPSTASAYNAGTGRLLWKTKDWHGISGTTSPVLWRTGEKKYIISAGLCFDSATGQALWSKAVPGNESTPVVADNQMVVISSLYTLAPEGATQVWAQKWGTYGEWRVSPLVYQGHLYCSDAGKHTWRCLDLKTGEAKWSKEGIATDMSSAVLADGKIITLGEPGHSHTEKGCGIVIFRATPDTYEEIGRFVPHAASCESPAIADGRLYFRTESEEGDYGVVCYDLRAAEN